MTLTQEQISRLVNELRNTLAGNNLSPALARLYSQHTRLRVEQPGLPTWQEEETENHLHNAIRLVSAALYEKSMNGEMWQDNLRRAAELMEWISHPQMNSDNLPLRFLASAAYQLAGFPARANGLLSEDTSQQDGSHILNCLLKADFVHLLQSLCDFWASKPGSKESSTDSDLTSDADSDMEFIRQWIGDGIVGALGIMCAEVRWGNEKRLQRAIDKLSAISMLFTNDEDSYTWLLAKLCAEVVSTYAQNSLRTQINTLNQTVNAEGKQALERYSRLAYTAGKALVWPSQIRGIRRLTSGTSFALCTPTGSGKTTVAELAILQSLFPNQATNNNPSMAAPLALYLVPSRALAAEVEAKLARVLKRIINARVIVTGLYGGTDWGPTDAWLTSQERTVLICTYEKAEALLRFLGTFFIDRVSLIAVDEAHSVQFDGDIEKLRSAESRSLRLETLSARLFHYIDQGSSRVIALSAVAKGIENTLAGWVTGQKDASPESITYRSTRQLVGRLLCLPDRRFEIRYDLLDGASLQFQDNDQDNSPYVPNPFSSFPLAPAWEREDTGPEKRLRPYLLWAAMSLASPEKKHAVLISITQGIEGYAEDFLTLLDDVWSNKVKPTYFVEPTDPEKHAIYQKCLDSCQDYFGADSREYRLLRKGIVVHHGRMPGPMARSLIEAIDQRVFHLVMATSTLSEGINLPFETVLIPSIRRGNDYLTSREFGNLVGRAGRPGYGTEGRSLVLFSSTGNAQPAQAKYHKLINALRTHVEDNEAVSITPQSPLAELITDIRKQWLNIVDTTHSSVADFANWLEQTAPVNIDTISTSGDDMTAVRSLDSLDGILLSVIVEIELTPSNVSDLEGHLRSIWQRSYAHFAGTQEHILEDIFIRRGRALRETIYPNVTQRRRLYRTSLPPKQGTELIGIYQNLREHLITGSQYTSWNKDEQLRYIEIAIEKLGTISKFHLEDKVGNTRVNWHTILRWWLYRQSSVRPSYKHIPLWHRYVSNNFCYKFNWGLGSIIALAHDATFGSEPHALTLDDWPKTGLPWVAFWMKELLVWGTLDPVAAYLLSRGLAITRDSAEALSHDSYYSQSQIQGLPTNEVLNASIIRTWAESIETANFKDVLVHGPASQLKVRLLRDFSNTDSRHWKVIPVENENNIKWVDPAGYTLAVCERPMGWNSQYCDSYDFILNTTDSLVLSSVYV